MIPPCGFSCVGRRCFLTILTPSTIRVFLDGNTFTATNWIEFKKQIKLGGFIRCGWDGSDETEQLIKQETKATIRCIISEVDDGSKCIYSNNDAKYEVIYARAY